MKKKPGEDGLVSRRSLMGRREALQSRREPGAMGSATRSSGGLPPGALTGRSRVAQKPSCSWRRGLGGQGPSVWTQQGIQKFTLTQVVSLLRLLLSVLSLSLLLQVSAFARKTSV